MKALGARCSVIAWFAMAAMVLASLAPSLSRAMAAAAGSDWVAVCTTQGTRWVQAGEEPSDSLPASGGEHCPACLMHSPLLAPAPSRLHFPLPAGLAHDVPRAFLAAPLALHAWASAQPRAPPAFS